MSKPPIISPEERLAEANKTKGVVLGESKIGKTYLLNELPEETTLFVNLEQGDMSVRKWRGDSVKFRTWQDCKDLICLLAGNDPRKGGNDDYSFNHYQRAKAKWGGDEWLNKYDIIFIDSLTIASKLSFEYCTTHPDNITSNGKRNGMAIYGMHGKVFVDWIEQIKNIQKEVWGVCGLQTKTTQTETRTIVEYLPLLDGSVTNTYLPHYFDVVITYTQINEGGKTRRAFVCDKNNIYGYPAGSRSSNLNTIEPPSLKALIEKIKTVKPEEEKQ